MFNNFIIFALSYNKKAHNNMKYLNRLFNLAGYDGLKHLVLSMLITKVLLLFLPLYLAILIALVISISKEVYDKISGRGCAEWKDVICNLIGILIGVW